MKLDPPNDTKSQDFLKRSSLYQEFLAEREEILRHKWIESEKAGKDIGFERALLDWIRNHRDGWRLARRTGRFPTSSGKGADRSAEGGKGKAGAPASSGRRSSAAEK